MPLRNSFLERRGKRLEDNKVKIRQTRNGQFTTTIPKKIALAAGLKKGSVVEFEIERNKININCDEECSKLRDY